MNKKEHAKALKEMKEAGEEMMEERGGEFSFGEWAGESEREIIESVTGFPLEDFTDEQVSELADVYLGF